MDSMLVSTMLKCPLPELLDQADKNKKSKLRNRWGALNKVEKFFPIFTFKISFVIGLGPLDENETTTGANSFFSAALFNIVAVGILLIFNKNATLSIGIYQVARIDRELIQIGT